MIDRVPPILRSTTPLHRRYLPTLLGSALLCLGPASTLAAGTSAMLSAAARNTQAAVEEAHQANSKSAIASQSFYATRFDRTPKAAAMTALGRQLFNDPRLSASGTLACASCHDPAHAYGPPDARPVRLGGADLKQPGLRAVPSLTYQQNVPPFNEHYSEDDGNDSEDQGPTGGRDWDGRADSAHEQASAPLLSPFEMANTDAAAVVGRVRSAAYAAQFREAFGDKIFDDPNRAFAAVTLSLETFQQSPDDFYPYSSKFDAVLRHQAKFTEQEARGLALFNDSRKGNCALCHISTGRGGASPQFTDNGLIALGAPRNPAIPANRDPAYFDLGLCGPLRTDLKDRKEFCGLFRTPSLRNVALRKTFFHNGVFQSLEAVMRFYVQRDIHPEKFYARGRNGKAGKFDDLPAAYWSNVNTEAPFDRKPGDKPALSDDEIKDIIVFLNTLTDGYKATVAAGVGLP